MADTTDVINPAKISEVVGRVRMATEADVDHALDQAQAAFQTWSRTTPEERASRLCDAARDLRSALPELTQEKTPTELAELLGGAPDRGLALPAL